MTVHYDGRAYPLAGDPEQYRRYVSRGCHHRIRPQQESERLGGIHVERERKHQSQRHRSAQSRQDAHYETDYDAQQHRNKGVLSVSGDGQYVRQPSEQGTKIIGYGFHWLLLMRKGPCPLRTTALCRFSLSAPTESPLLPFRRLYQELEGSLLLRSYAEYLVHPPVDVVARLTVQVQPGGLSIGDEFRVRHGVIERLL